MRQQTLVAKEPTLAPTLVSASARLPPRCVQGDLSLLATPGGRGLPVGHVVAYQPTHALQAAFVLKVLQAGTGAPTQAPGP